MARYREQSHQHELRTAAIRRRRSLRGPSGESLATAKHKVVFGECSGTRVECRLSTMRIQSWPEVRFIDMLTERRGVGIGPEERSHALADRRRIPGRCTNATPVL